MLAHDPLTCGIARQAIARNQLVGSHPARRIAAGHVRRPRIHAWGVRRGVRGQRRRHRGGWWPRRKW
eukprot:scaffold54697_cov70-Phaeocystis_antarctica.AAC.8